MRLLTSCVFFLFLWISISSGAWASSRTGEISQEKGKVVFNEKKQHYVVTNPKKVKKYTGHQVKVSGVVDPGTQAMTVTSIHKTDK